MSTIAILGVGKMGAAMAKELDIAGHQLKLWNRTKSKADALAANLSNAIAVETVADAIADSDIALTLFLSGAVTEETLLTDPSVLQAAKKSIIIIDMGTSGVDSATRLDKAIKAAGLTFIDAPVSGSITTIAAHQLLVMASGSADAIERVTPALSVFSKRVIRVGEVGAGQTMKLAVNLIVHSLNAALSESLALATTAGLDAASVYEVFDESVIAAPFIKYKKASFLDKSTPVAMRIDAVVKDLGLITKYGDELGLDLQGAKASAALYMAAVAHGHESEDMSALSRHIQGE